jgi:hypothetical protein
LFLGVAGQVGAFGQRLSDQAVGVLVGASLPRTMRITEVHGDAGRLGNPLELVGEGLQDVGGWVRQLDQDEQPTAPVYRVPTVLALPSPF